MSEFEWRKRQPHSLSTAEPDTANDRRNHYDKPHDVLADGFRKLIHEQQERDAAWNASQPNPKLHLHRTPERIIRSAIEQEVGKSGLHSTFWHPLKEAWDAVALDRYPPQSLEKMLAEHRLAFTYDATQQSTITLKHPLQVRILDALSEACDIPREKGQREIEIPARVKNRR